MSAVDASSPDTPSSHDATQQFTAVRMPIEEPIDGREEALQKLKGCSHTELHRARKRHRRALESLENGGYSSLPDDTRERLRGQLRGNLDILNHALDSAHSEPVETEETQPESAETAFLDRLRTVLQNLWSA